MRQPRPKRNLVLDIPPFEPSCDRLSVQLDAAKDENLPESPDCEHAGAVRFALIAGSALDAVIANTRLAPTLPGTTLRERAWLAVRAITELDPASRIEDQWDSYWLLSLFGRDWSAFLAEYGPRLQFALTCAPLLDERRFEAEDYDALRASATRLGREQGRAAAKDIDIDDQARELLRAGQPIYRPGFFPEPRRRVLHRTYLFARLEAELRRRAPELARTDLEGIAFTEVFDAIFDGAFFNGGQEALADRIGIVPNPYRPAGGGDAVEEKSL